MYKSVPWQFRAKRQRRLVEQRAIARRAAAIRRAEQSAISASFIAKLEHERAANLAWLDYLNAERAACHEYLDRAITAKRPS